MRTLLPTGSVTRNPDFTDHRRILEHTPPTELELSIYGSWDESVVEDLHGLPIVTAHADKRIGASLSGDGLAANDWFPFFGRKPLDEQPSAGADAMAHGLTSGANECETAIELLSLFAR